MRLRVSSFANNADASKKGLVAFFPLIANNRAQLCRYMFISVCVCVLCCVSIRTCLCFVCGEGTLTDFAVSFFFFFFFNNPSFSHSLWYAILCYAGYALLLIVLIVLVHKVLYYSIQPDRREVKIHKKKAQKKLFVLPLLSMLVWCWYDDPPSPSPSPRPFPPYLILPTPGSLLGLMLRCPILYMI